MVLLARVEAISRDVRQRGELHHRMSILLQNNIPQRDEGVKQAKEDHLDFPRVL